MEFKHFQQRPMPALASKLEITTAQTSRPNDSCLSALAPPAFEVDKTDKDNAKSHIAAANGCQDRSYI